MEGKHKAAKWNCREYMDDVLAKQTALSLPQSVVTLELYTTLDRSVLCDSCMFSLNFYKKQHNSLQCLYIYLLCDHF